MVDVVVVFTVVEVEFDSVLLSTIIGSIGGTPS